MKISTKGRYGLRLMLDLSLQSRDVFVPLKEIAARQQLPEKYLEQIITPLNRAGYLKGARGAQGGYQLTKNPHEYTVGMILRTMEGDLRVVSLLDSNKITGDQTAGFVINQVWEKMNDALAQVVDHITLEDLIQNYAAKAGHQPE